ncbi:hypothetical protein B0H14DRAFT_2654567 [Mycena olivaceomarginata]|nr:hypothetical protein B0H14DRAFT_2654567 [Mycena olivaceomarginata]
MRTSIVKHWLSMTMFHLRVFFAVLWMSTLAFSIPTFNITIPVPDGTSNHGDPSILCTPTNWTSILSFFFGNYIAHAATTLSYPGEELFDYALTVVGALLFPSTGVCRGLDAIFRFARRAESDLMCAARAGAFVKTSNGLSYREPLRRRGRYLGWLPIGHLPFWTFLEAPCDSRKIHGVIRKLPPGYKFEVVPRNAVIEIPTAGADTRSVVICTSQQTAKLMVAILQTFYGAVTLYRARGDQLARYGYAAFALTVAPYTVMSLINLVGGPSHTYLSHYVSHRQSDTPEPYFDGTVGRLKQANEGPAGRSKQAVETPAEERPAEEEPAEEEPAREEPAREEQEPQDVGRAIRDCLIDPDATGASIYIIFGVAGGIPAGDHRQLDKVQPRQQHSFATGMADDVVGF